MDSIPDRSYKAETTRGRNFHRDIRRRWIHSREEGMDGLTGDREGIKYRTSDLQKKSSERSTDISTATRNGTTLIEREMDLGI